VYRYLRAVNSSISGCCDVIIRRNVRSLARSLGQAAARAAAARDAEALGQQSASARLVSLYD